MRKIPVKLQSMLIYHRTYNASTQTIQLSKHPALGLHDHKLVIALVDIL